MTLMKGMERDKDMSGSASYLPRGATPSEGYERAITRLQAALDLALCDEDGVAGDEVRSYLDAARAEIDGQVGLPGESVDLAMARIVARRMAADPLGSLTSQKTDGGLALRTLLRD